jgi:hypothetical protein
MVLTVVSLLKQDVRAKIGQKTKITQTSGASSRPTGTHCPLVPSFCRSLLQVKGEANRGDNGG